jgi:hypothetical protein
VTRDACETTPARVPRSNGAKQAGEVRTRWAWTERTVWTDRMLTALAYFAEHGLFSMEAAHVRLRQSVVR